MKWACLYCKTEVETDADINKKHRCGSCGAAMAPHSVLVTVEDGQKVIDYGNRSAWLYFTNCPNAAMCQRHDQYRPSCEELAMTPRCLVAMAATIDRLDRRIDQMTTGGKPESV